MSGAAVFRPRVPSFPEGKAASRIRSTTTACTRTSRPRLSIVATLVSEHNDSFLPRPRDDIGHAFATSQPTAPLPPEGDLVTFDQLATMLLCERVSSQQPTLAQPGVLHDRHASATATTNLKHTNHLTQLNTIICRPRHPRKGNTWSVSIREAIRSLPPPLASQR